MGQEFQFTYSHDGCSILKLIGFPIQVACQVDPGHAMAPFVHRHPRPMLRMISFPWHQNAFGGVSSGGEGGILWDIQYFFWTQSYPQIKLELLELGIHIMYHRFFRIN